MATHYQEFMALLSTCPSLIYEVEAIKNVFLKTTCP